MTYPCSECMAGTMHGPEECTCTEEDVEEFEIEDLDAGVLHTRPSKDIADAVVCTKAGFMTEEPKAEFIEKSEYEKGIVYQSPADVEKMTIALQHKYSFGTCDLYVEIAEPDFRIVLEYDLMWHREKNVIVLPRAGVEWLIAKLQWILEQTK